MQIQVTEKNGVYTATIPLLLRDGTQLLVQGSASVAGVYDDFGLPEEVGGIFDDVGKFFKKVAKNKAIRKAVKITKDVIKSPITTAALGVVTGGAAIAPMAAANVAVRLAEQAAKGGKQARKVIQSSIKLADKPRTPQQIAKLKEIIRKQPKAPLALPAPKAAFPEPSKKVKDLLGLNRIHKFVMTLQPTV